jgi:hypothetical protein
MADTGDRDLAAVAALLLNQGVRVDAFSRLVTVGALFTLLLLPIAIGPPNIFVVVVLGPVTLVGLGEAYLAVRVGFDAALFRRLANDEAGFDLDRLDASLLRLQLIPAGKTGRTIDQRIAGARRLLQWQGLLLALQAALMLGGAGLAAFDDWRGL